MRYLKKNIEQQTSESKTENPPIRLSTKKHQQLVFFLHDKSVVILCISCAKSAALEFYNTELPYFRAPGVILFVVISSLGTLIQIAS